MKRTILLAAAAAFSCAMAFGQGPSVSLQNQEDSTFYYVVDPQELAGLSAGSPLLASKVAGYFAAADKGVTFRTLAPQAVVKLTDLADGSHLLVGFFAQMDADVFPVRVMAVQSDTSVGDRFYAVFASPAQLSVRRGVGKLSPFGSPAGTTVAAAAGTTPETTPSGSTAATTTSANPDGGTTPSGQDAGAAAIPAIATFAAAYDPAVFTRESKGSFTVLPIDQSRSWTQTGTRIASLQGEIDASGVKLVINAPGGFSPSVSYFLYVFDARTPGGENPLTLEIEPLARGDKGACILWQKGAGAPRLLGTVKTSATAVELDVGQDELATGAFAPAGSSPTVDLTAAWYDKALGMWEEFYYTTFPAPVPATR
jgi:hypothetical protein